MRERISSNLGQACLWDRDMALTLKDILNIKQSLDIQKASYTTDDARAVDNWVREARLKKDRHVLFYQVHRRVESGSISEKQPFILVFATDWMLQNMASMGHGAAVSMDATFGTNMYSVIVLAFFVYHSSGTYLLFLSAVNVPYASMVIVERLCYGCFIESE